MPCLLREEWGFLFDRSLSISGMDWKKLMSTASLFRCFMWWLVPHLLPLCLCVCSLVCKRSSWLSCAHRMAFVAFNMIRRYAPLMVGSSPYCQVFMFIEWARWESLIMTICIASSTSYLGVVFQNIVYPIAITYVHRQNTWHLLTDSVACTHLHQADFSALFDNIPL